jgi:hypothetical protein
MNPEQQMEQEIQLGCEGEDCDNQDRDTRAELVEKGWNWKEGSLHGLFNIFAAECPECSDVDVKQIFDEKVDDVEKMYNKHSSESSRDPAQTKLGEAA